MPIDNKDLFSAEFKEVGDAIRHFSTTRSALTTFLLTLGLAAFGAYFHKQQTSPFFIVAGFTFLTAAVAVCFRFSFLTERYRDYHKVLWEAATKAEMKGTESTGYPSGVRNHHPPFRDVWAKMRHDWMNWLLVAVVCVLGIGFIAAALGRDESAGVPIAVCVVLVTAIGASLVLVWMRNQGAPFHFGVVFAVMWAVCAVVLLLLAYWYRPTPRESAQSTLRSAVTATGGVRERPSNEWTMSAQPRRTKCGSWG